MNVLIVDDEADVRFVARLILDRVAGMNVSEASSGEEGIARARVERPSFILLDMMMPGMDGAATLRALRADTATSSIPVVFLTAHGSDAQALKDLGATGVIRKPFDALSLVDQIRTILRA